MIDPSKRKSLDGQVALVSGSGRGIGSEIVAYLARSGATVVVSGRGANVRQTADRLAAQSVGADIMACQLDVLSPVDWANAVEEIRDRFGRIDILVNNAGGMVARTDLVDLEDADWDYALRINLDSVFYGCRAVAPLMIERRSGTIVNIGSFFGEIPQPQFGAYCCAKAAVKALSQSLALELAPHNITVNAIAPGYIESDMYRQALDSLSVYKGITVAEAEELVLASIPAGRVGRGEELGATIEFLASPGGRYFTAQSLIQGGGVLYR